MKGNVKEQVWPASTVDGSCPSQKLHRPHVSPSLLQLQQTVWGMGIGMALRDIHLQRRCLFSSTDRCESRGSSAFESWVAPGGEPDEGRGGPAGSATKRSVTMSCPLAFCSPLSPSLVTFG